MSRTDLRAPDIHGSILADPGLGEIEQIVAANRATLDCWHYDFQGRSAARVRAMTRQAVLAMAAEYTHDQALPLAALDPRSLSGPPPSTLHPPPLILTGHQPELFHPGVWLKNFVSYNVARQYGGVSLHLVVDNDTVKGTTVRVPTGSPSEPSVVHVPLDRWRGEIPYEEYEIADEELFAGFGQRVLSAMRSLGVAPLVESLWPTACGAGVGTRRLGERIALARRRQEVAWGCENLELPASGLCRTEGFAWFACHLLAQIEPFHRVYNRALDQYRKRNGVRSRNHPVPPLEQDGEWHEAPFWVWKEGASRRCRLFVQQQGKEMLLTDRDQWTARLPLAPDREACCAVEAMADLARRGVKIRTRALTTTIFARLCLADLFIHGLGGARYDAMADEVMRRFFSIEPPRFLMLTGTLHLPIPAQPVNSAQAEALRRLLRDLTYNPDRHLPESDRTAPDLAEVVRQKWNVVRREPELRTDRRARFEEIRRLNERLAPAVADARLAAAHDLERVQSALSANAILKKRDWAFCLYPPDTLHSLFDRFVEKVPFVPDTFFR